MIVHRSFLLGECSKKRFNWYSLFSVIDSSGRYSSQFFFGNDFWLGSHNLCDELQNQKTNKVVPPFEAKFFVAKLFIQLHPIFTPSVSFWSPDFLSTVLVVKILGLIFTVDKMCKSRNLICFLNKHYFQLICELFPPSFQGSQPNGPKTSSQFNLSSQTWEFQISYTYIQFIFNYFIQWFKKGVFFLVNRFQQRRKPVSN